MSIKKSAFTFSHAMCIFFLAANLSAEEGLKLQFNENGLSSLQHLGEELLLTEKNQLPRISGINIENAGSTENVTLKQISSTFDSTAQTLSMDYGVVVHSIRYQQQGDRLALYVSLTNKTADQTILPGFAMHLMGLKIDGASLSLRGNAPFAFQRFDERSLAVTSFANYRDNSISLQANKLSIKPNDVEEIVTVGVDPSLYKNDSHKKLSPGEVLNWEVSLYFGSKETSPKDLLSKDIKEFTNINPIVLKWDDRRPIGIDFISSAGLRAEKNHRGWFNDAKLDINTPEGVKEFKEKMFKRVQNNLDNLKKLNAQGIILWDIEGQEFKHPISYMGDPRHLAETTPEMDAIADEVFAAYRNAGFKVGICIRPSKIVKDTSPLGIDYKKKTGRDRWTHVEARNPIENMIDKIDYSKKRWGATIFYLDSNVNGTGMSSDGIAEKTKGVPHVIPAHWMEAINKAHPDVLVIPEWNNPESARFSAPYRSSNLNQTNNPNGFLYPGSFAVVMPSMELLKNKRSDYLQGNINGDILLTNTWYEDQRIEHISFIYQEGLLLREGMPEAIKSASAKDLSQSAMSPAIKDRFWAAVRAGQLQDIESGDLLKELAFDAEIVVQKAAFEQLSKRPDCVDDKIISLMKKLITEPTQAGEPLTPFACELLAACGNKTVPLLIELLNSQDNKLFAVKDQLIKALGTSGTKDPQAIELLTDILRNKEKRTQRLVEPAIIALGELKAREALPTIIAYNYSNDPFMVAEIVQALRSIADPRAVESIIQNYFRGNWGVVVYHYRKILDQALTELTGEKQQDWVEWYLNLSELQKEKYRMRVDDNPKDIAPWLPLENEIEISRDASYVPASIKKKNHFQLFGDSLLRQGAFSGAAFETDTQHQNIVIDLGKMQLVKRIVIANDKALFKKSQWRKLLEVSGSADGQQWTKVWDIQMNSEAAGRFEWNITLNPTKSIRYIKISETENDRPLALQRVRIFSEK